MKMVILNLIKVSKYWIKVLKIKKFRCKKEDCKNIIIYYGTCCQLFFKIFKQNFIYVGKKVLKMNQHFLNFMKIVLLW